MSDLNIEQYKSGTHNMFNNEVIPVDASQDSQNWITNEGVIEIVRGREIIGNEGDAGAVYNEWFGYRNDNTKVHFRKALGKIQVLIGSTWTDVITNLTKNSRVTFQNYSSLAGTFVYIFCQDGIFQIHTANPTSYIQLKGPTSADLPVGTAIIDKARTLLWGTKTDKTGLYGSRIDTQRVGTQYTQVTNEVLATGDGVQTVFTGTLAFKSGNPLATAFGININENPSGLTATDNVVGVISGTGITGTINYVTGEYSLTFTNPVASGTQVRATYLYANSNSNGITDFSYTSPIRLASEGFVLRQDEGGDPIMKVVVGPDGNYYSFKKDSVYQLTISDDDVTFTNIVYRKNIGIPSTESVVSTGAGIIFIDTSNPSNPRLTILEKNPLGDNLNPRILFPHYKFENLFYDEDAIVTNYGKFILVNCKSEEGIEPDVLLICNLQDNTVDRTYYGSKSLAQDGYYLYGGSPFEQTTYRLLVDFDDDGVVPENQWTGRGERYEVENLKKFRKIRVKGLIDLAQWYEIQANYDDSGWQVIGTIRGDGSYVDYNNPQLVGGPLVGGVDVGGDGVSTVYPYFTEIKVKPPKFRKRYIRYVAKGLGYVSIQRQSDFDILIYEERLPSQYRQKQYVSLDGTQSDLPNPQW